MTTFFKLICFLPFAMAAVCFVFAMLNDKRDSARFKREREEDALAADLSECDRSRWPTTAFAPGSVR
jgi:hypothetical protein